MLASARYQNGAYLRMHPSWHADDSDWKARHALRMLSRNNLSPCTIAEVGCGAGGILSTMQNELDPECEFWGYEISPQAMQLCRGRGNQRLHFVEGGLSALDGRYFDLLLVMDVVEHVDDYIAFLRQLRSLGRVKMFHMPLDLSVQGLIRNIPGRLRKSAGHLHYFTKPLFLQALEEAGYRVKECFYTQPAIEGSWSSPMSRFAAIPRKIAFSINQDASALLLGGCSLMVYAV